MLQRDETGKPEPEIQLHGFVVGAEMIESVSPQAVVNKLSDALQFVEGVGRIDVQYLGPIELVDPTSPQGDGASKEWPEMTSTTSVVED